MGELLYSKQWKIDIRYCIAAIWALKIRRGFRTTDKYHVLNAVRVILDGKAMGGFTFNNLLNIYADGKD